MASPTMATRIVSKMARRKDAAKVMHPPYLKVRISHAGVISTVGWCCTGAHRRRPGVTGAAARLNVNRVSGSPAIFLGEETLAVIGILDDVAREPDLLNAIIVPNGFARDRLGLSAVAEVHIEIEIGAAELSGGLSVKYAARFPSRIVAIVAVPSPPTDVIAILERSRIFRCRALRATSTFVPMPS